MLGFSSRHDPESKAVVLLGVLLDAYFVVLYAFLKLCGFNFTLKHTYFNVLIGTLAILIMVVNFYIFTRNKFHRKNYTHFENKKLLRSFWKEELVFYLFISMWLIGLIVFTAIANPGFKR